MYVVVDLEGRTILELTPQVVFVEIPDAGLDAGLDDEDVLTRARMLGHPIIISKELDYEDVVNRARRLGRPIIISNEPTQISDCPYCTASRKEKRKAAEKILSRIVAQEISGDSYRCVIPEDTDLVLARRLMKKLKKMVNDDL